MIFHTATIYAAVALGSVIGSVLRVAASAMCLELLGPAFPWGTLMVNVTGSFAIGCFAALTAPTGHLEAWLRRRHFVMTGICGGYTTFSAFSLETLRLLQAGSEGMAAANVALSVGAWIGAAWLGHAAATRFVARRRA